MQLLTHLHNEAVRRTGGKSASLLGGPRAPKKKSEGWLRSALRRWVGTWRILLFSAIVQSRPHASIPFSQGTRIALQTTLLRPLTDCDHKSAVQLAERVRPRGGSGGGEGSSSQQPRSWLNQRACTRAIEIRRPPRDGTSTSPSWRIEDAPRSAASYVGRSITPTSRTSGVLRDPTVDCDRALLGEEAARPRARLQGADSHQRDSQLTAPRDSLQIASASAPRRGIYLRNQPITTADDRSAQLDGSPRRISITLVVLCATRVLWTALTGLRTSRPLAAVLKRHSAVVSGCALRANGAA